MSASRGLVAAAVVMWMAAGGSGVALGSGARASWAAAGTSPDFEWSGTIAAGQAIEIKGVNGSIEATPAAGKQVEVRAVKHAHHSDPDEVKIEVIQHPGGVTICTLYPSSRWRPPNTCEPGEGGHSHVDHNDVQVEYSVRVPAGVRFVGRAVNGGIDAHGLGGPVEASTVNGSVTIETRATAEAATVNGSIEARVGSSRWSGALSFETVNGRIRVLLPNDASAEVRASTVNGEILSDFPVTIRGRISSRRMTGTIGKGGGSLQLENVNGDIRLVASP